MNQPLHGDAIPFAYTHPRRPTDPAVDEAMTDAAHAERFAAAYSNDVRYDHRRKLYYIYQAPLWRADLDGHIYRLAIEFARARQAEALTIPDRKVRETAVQHFIRAESKASLDRLVSLAQKLPPIADNGDNWDVHPLLAGAPNGIIDLQTGDLRPSDPADRITLSVRVPYDVHAVAPRFEAFIAEIFNGDVELMTFVQRFAGYSLTGLTSEQVLVVGHGCGANGKSTLLNTLSDVFGEYALNMPFTTIEVKQRSTITNDLAALAGKRFVTASETNDGSRFNEARIKALTGCDPITARFLYAESFTFRPQAKFILSVNHRPEVKDDSFGFWRRLRLVPFVRTFTGPERDPNLEKYFKTTEAAGILRWIVAGCLDWQRHGLGEPAAVMAATAEYREDSDPLTDFLADCCELDPGAETKASALAERYLKWAERQRMSKADRLSPKDLGKRLADRFTRKHRNDGKVYEGIRLVTEKLW
jgi:putative DNA primase/helicase